MVIHQNQSNTVVFTFQEYVTPLNPYYLVVVTNDTTKVSTSFICTDSSSFPQRYNQFVINETNGEQDRLNSAIALRPSGWWSYKIYEQESATNLDYSLAGNQVDAGRFRVSGSDDSNYYV